MHGDLAILVLILILGCAAFVFGVIYMIGRAVALLGRRVWGLFSPSSRDSSGCCGARPPGVWSVCTRDGCRLAERRRDARYCSRCGAPLAIRR